MKIRVKQQQLTNIVNAIAVLNDEGTLDVQPDALTFRGMDPSHIALTNIEYPKDAFVEYEVESAVKFGVRVGELLKVLKRFGKDDVVGLGLTQDSANLIVSSDENKFYTLRLIEASASSTPLPKLELKATIEVRYEVLAKIFDDIKVISEYLRVETKSGIAYFGGKGDSGEASISLSQQAIAKITTSEDSIATYSLDYLVKMVKAVKTDDVKLEYSTKMPLKMSFDGERIQYYLAPRVQE